MEMVDDTELFRLACKQEKSWGVRFSFCGEWGFDDIERSMKWLEDDDLIHQAIIDGHGAVFVSSQEEVDEIFDNTFGDDSDCSDPKWEGCKASVYLLSCSPEGELRNENT